VNKLLALFKYSTHSFPDQEPGEEVVALIRKHWFTVLFPMFLVFIALLLPIVVGVTLREKLLEVELWNLYLFVSSIWYLLFWLVALRTLMLYSLNTVIVTNHRIIDNDQYGFFDRKVSELHIRRVQDVSVHTVGVLQTFLHFGDITVQTAASEKQFVFSQIPRPEVTKDTIMRIVGSQYSGVKEYV
jgi:uncharacterized membrane protein YdbT with pleckstrin-like domain